MLNLYRRHTSECPYKPKGRRFTRKCDCPIWIHGYRSERADEPLIWKSIGTHDMDAADAELKRRYPAENGAAPPAAPLLERKKISEAIERHLKEKEIEGNRSGTLANHRAILSRLAEFCEEKKLTWMDELSLEYFADYRRERAKQTPSYRTRQKEVDVLRNFCAFCVENDWIKKNFAKSLKRPQPPEVTDGDDEPDLPHPPYTPDEMRTMLAACGLIEHERHAEYERQRLRAAILTLHNTGLRISDTAALKRARVRPDGTITVYQIKTKGDPVDVQLKPDTLAALKQMPPDPRNDYAPSPYFFWNGEVQRRTVEASIRSSMRRLGEITGIDVHPHRFRNTFAVELIEAGKDIYTVSKLLGHKSVKITERYYLHWIRRTRERFLAAVQDLPDYGAMVPAKVIEFPKAVNA